MPLTEPDPLSFLLNKLPNKRKRKLSTSSASASSASSTWMIRWPALRLILFELDYLHHGELSPKTSPSPPWYQAGNLVM
ncbi:hypothetical protein G6F56_011707 [Rhizopus delemar]|nr:hypothetical protein G6F56_011707 [Rhizopus delemar]